MSNRVINTHGALVSSIQPTQNHKAFPITAQDKRKCQFIFFYDNCMVIQISLKFVPKSPNNNRPALIVVQWNLSETTTSLIKIITCALFCNVF